MIIDVLRTVKRIFYFFFPFVITSRQSAGHWTLGKSRESRDGEMSTGNVGNLCGYVKDPGIPSDIYFLLSIL